MLLHVPVFQPMVKKSCPMKKTISIFVQANRYLGLDQISSFTGPTIGMSLTGLEEIPLLTIETLDNLTTLILT